MPVADWTIQCHARSGPLMAGGGLLVTAGFDSLAECFRTPAWRCRPVSFFSAWVIPAGVASAAWPPFDPSSGTSWPGNAPIVAFAAPVSATMAEPGAVSLLADGKTA
jgi:hypothetical protein